MYNHLYFGLDAHKRTCTLAGMDPSGEVVSARTFPTSESLLIRNVSRIHAKTKWLALEESTLSGWIAGVLRPHVDRLIVCDPLHNTLISRGGNKDDVIDAIKICRLLRLYELKEVYHSDEGHRVDFKIAVQQYLRISKDLSSLKTQLKAKYHQAGLVHVTGTEVFTKKHRVRFLDQLSTPSRRKVFALLYDRLDATDRSLKKAKAVMVELGQRYREIAQFQHVPGIGVVGSHVFSAFIQTPHRFGTKQQLWRYCKLGVRERSSAGKPLGYKRLDRSGSGELKSVSYRCWQSSLRTKDPNEVSQFYEASLLRTNNSTHARLNTQRKVLAVLWTIWKNDVDYNPSLFYSPPVSATIAQTVAIP